MHISTKEVMEKARSKFASQEKVTNFDPPVRTGGCNEIRVPTGNISHFEWLRNFDGREWGEHYNITVGCGYTYCNGGFSTKRCPNCHADLVVGMSVYLNGEETDYWVDSCAGCGYARLEVAIHETRLVQSV